MSRLLAALLLLGGCATTPAGPSLTEPSAAQLAVRPDERLQLTLPRLEGGAPWSLAEHRGRVVLLDVWATWCEPCRDAMPLYGDLSREFRERGLDVLTINVDASPAGIPAFLAEARVSLPVLRDPEAKVAEAQLKVKLMPTAFLVDRDGRVRFVHEGYDEGELSTWLEQVELLIREHPK